MPGIRETRTLPYSAKQMFDLVADVARYPEFLPWVIATRVRSDSGTEMVADMLVGFKALREKFTSRVIKDRPHRIEVIYNPILPPKSITSNADVEALWKGEGPRLISVGSLNSVKNHALLLDAFARLKGDAQLMILGEGPLRGELERQAERLGVGKRVIMPGFAVDLDPGY